MGTMSWTRFPLRLIYQSSLSLEEVLYPCIFLLLIPKWSSLSKLDNGSISDIWMQSVEFNLLKLIKVARDVNLELDGVLRKVQ